MKPAGAAPAGPSPYRSLALRRSPQRPRPGVLLGAHPGAGVTLSGLRCLGRSQSLRPPSGRTEPTSMREIDEEPFI